MTGKWWRKGWNVTTAWSRAASAIRHWDMVTYAVIYRYSVDGKTGAVRDNWQMVTSNRPLVSCCWKNPCRLCQQCRQDLMLATIAVPSLTVTCLEQLCLHSTWLSFREPSSTPQRSLSRPVAVSSSSAHTDLSFTSLRGYSQGAARFSSRHYAGNWRSKWNNLIYACTAYNTHK